MRLTATSLGVALVVFGPSCTRAATVTYTLTGELVGQPTTTPTLQGQFPAGLPWTYTFTLNTATPDSDPSPTHGYYVNGLVSASGSIGSYQFSTGAGNVDVTSSS